MPLPPIATIAACGGIVTSIKSSWELSRMLRQKRKEVKEQQKKALQGGPSTESFDSYDDDDERIYDEYGNPYKVQDILAKQAAVIAEQRNYIESQSVRRDTLTSRRSFEVPRDQTQFRPIAYDNMSSYGGPPRRSTSTRMVAPPPISFPSQQPDRIFREASYSVSSASSDAAPHWRHPFPPQQQRTFVHRESRSISPGRRAPPPPPPLNTRYRSEYSSIGGSPRSGCMDSDDESDYTYSRRSRSRSRGR